MFVKLFGFVVGMAGYLMLVLLGGWLVFKADRLPEGWPNYKLTFIPFVHPVIRFPESLGAKLERLEAAEAAAAKHNTVVVQRQNAITADAQAKAIQIQTRIHTVTRTLIEQVPYAIQPPVDPVLPVGFVRLHDAAALGLPSVPPATPGADAGPSGAKASDALTTVVGNYGAANECFAQDAGLKDWIRQMEAVK